MKPLSVRAVADAADALDGGGACIERLLSHLQTGHALRALSH